MSWGGHSDTYHAQVVANEANERIQHETNQWNYDIAHEANMWNWNNLQAQNAWNLEQWERENAYNDPSAQMQRLIRAGINPIMAAGNITAGEAMHLESGQAAPAAVPTMEAARVNPAYDEFAMQRIGNVIAAARDLMNAGQGFKRLGIEEMNANTSRAAQLSQEQLNRASIVEKRAATNALEIQNQWNTQTFGARADLVAAGLDKTRKELSLLDKQSELYQSQKAKYDADVAFVREKTNRIAEDYQIQWSQLDVARKQAEASMKSANAQQAQVSLGYSRLQVDSERLNAEIQKWNNDQRLQWLDRFASEYSGNVSVHAEGKSTTSVGLPGTGQKFEFSGGASGSFGVRGRSADEATLKTLNYEAIKRYGEDPTEENAKVVQKSTEITNQYITEQENAARVAPLRRLSESSVLNPSQYQEDMNDYVVPFEANMR